ncbi:MAG: copper resistance protein B [Woeseia sp.]
MNDKSMIMFLLPVLSFVLLPTGAGAGASDDPMLIMLELDQLEARDFGGDNEKEWDAQGWIGKDLTKVWMKSEGERASGSTKESELQILYGKAVTTYWDFQFGVRRDFEPSPSRSWVAIGFQGLAPYFFEIDTALFIGEAGRTALRFEAEYELLFTQRFILTPEIEINMYGRSDPDIRIGSGLSDIEAGLRLRYEIRREFAPYLGVNWSKRFGRTAELARQAGDRASDTALAVGIRAWF